MPRSPRVVSQTGIYHILFSGLNLQTIFKDEADHEMFLMSLNELKPKGGYQVFAYCLMGNHIHLLMKAEKETPGQSFKRIGARYVYWYNQKYDRAGPLFQGRYKSEVVESDDYLKTVLRFIHQNPLKAGIVSRLENYVWSSYCEYIGLHNTDYVDKQPVLALFHDEPKQAVADFKAFNEMDNHDQCLELTGKRRMNDERAIQLIRREYAVRSPKDILDFDPEKGASCIKSLLSKGISIRQLSRLTGVSRYSLMGIKEGKKDNRDST